MGVGDELVNQGQHVADQIKATGDQIKGQAIDGLTSIAGVALGGADEVGTQVGHVVGHIKGRLGQIFGA